MTKSAFTIGLLVMLLSVPAFGASINKSIKIGAGEEAGGATSVNGSISVGADAVVTGNLKTVNGTIRVDAGAQIQKASTVNGGLRISENVRSENLSTVNGSVKVGAGASVDGDVSAVNGRITLERGASTADGVANVNGQIELSGATVGGNIETVNGDIELADQSIVRGDIRVEKPGGWGWGKEKRRKPRIVIGPGSRVEGDIDVERKVELYISDTAEVGGVTGEMSMDDAERFSGERP
ncbi:MAG: hypothetical protein QNJ14_18625 [Woeseiaceae bacterium]|nr:hypothetical protein [Woeseiaceae bacterium]